MWNTESMWFEIALVSFVLLLGHIFLGHFEERTSKLRKFGKQMGWRITMELHL